MSPRSMLSEPPAMPPTFMGTAPDVGSVIVVGCVVVVLLMALANRNDSYRTSRKKNANDDNLAPRRSASGMGTFVNRYGTSAYTTRLD